MFPLYVYGGCKFYTRSSDESNINNKLVYEYNEKNRSYKMSRKTDITYIHQIIKDILSFTQSPNSYKFYFASPAKIAMTF